MTYGLDNSITRMRQNLHGSLPCHDQLSSTFLTKPKRGAYFERLRYVANQLWSTSDELAGPVEPANGD